MVAVVTTIKALVVYWALYFFIKWLMALRPNGFVVVMRLVGGLCFAFIPLWVMTISGTKASFIHINTQDVRLIIFCLLLGIPIILAANFLNSKNTKQQALYPPIRIKEWGFGLILADMATWAVYLLAYEFMFRGFLLFQCMGDVGITAAITINVVIYAAAHIPKGWFEAIGSVPLGILFCAIAIATNSFWTVFVLHFVIASSNDLISVWRNPSFSFKTTR